MQFKTNINCGGCVAKVTPFLNEVVGTGRWSVDVADPARILTVTSDTVTAEDIKTGLDKLGYKAETI